MDPRLLEYYQKELKFIRELGAEFGREYPALAPELGVEDLKRCPDPYVERLLEGFAFLAGRVHLQIDTEYPRLAQNILETTDPALLRPIPSMSIVQFQPDLADTNWVEGHTVERGSTVECPRVRGRQQRARFTTAHDVEVWPIEITDVQYLDRGSALPIVGDSTPAESRAAIRFELTSRAGVPWSKLPLDRLRLHLRGSEEIPARIYEQLIVDRLAIKVAGGSAGRPTWLGPEALVPVGFKDEESLLPSDVGFSGFRLLREFFALPERFFFVDVVGLADAVRTVDSETLEITVHFGKKEPHLEGMLRPDYFALHCTPAINLFEKLAHRVPVKETQREFHLVPQRDNASDFEVFSIESLDAYRKGAPNQPHRLLPVYSPLGRPEDCAGTYSVERTFTVEKEKRPSGAAQYVGSEIYLTLGKLDDDLDGEIHELEARILCTHRDLPELLKKAGDLPLSHDAPDKSIPVRMLRGPTSPCPAPLPGSLTWKLVNQLAVHRTNFEDLDRERGAVALREMLELYREPKNAKNARQVEGVRSIATEAVYRKLPGAGPVAFGRGLELSVTLEEAAFAGVGVVVIGAIIREIFSRSVTTNSFAETAIRTVERGEEVVRWPMSIGSRGIR